MKIFDFEMSPGGVMVDMNSKNIESISESAVDSRAAMMSNLKEVVEKLQHATDDVDFTAEDNSTVMVECFNIQRTLNKLVALTISSLGAYYSLECRFNKDGETAILPWKSKLEQVSEDLKSNGVDIKNVPVKSYSINTAVFSKGCPEGATFKCIFFDNPFAVMQAPNIASAPFENMYSEETCHLNLFGSMYNYCYEFSDKHYRNCVDRLSEVAKIIYVKLYDAQSIAHSLTDMSGAEKILSECVRCLINMQAAAIECVMEYGLRAYNAMRTFDTVTVLALHADSIVKEISNSSEVNN